LTPTSLLSFNFPKPSFYSFSEQRYHAADRCSAPASFPDYGELAHPQLEVEVCYCEQPAWQQLRLGEGCFSYVAELFSTSPA